ncbi:MAG: alpha/beta fold hydrolase [Pseudomonadota bacterium]
MTSPFADRFDFADGGVSRPVFHSGVGPAVLLLHELPGMTPEFWRLGRRIADAGFAVFAPDLYGRAGAREPTRPSLAGGLVRACISRHIHLLATDRASPITDWLRALAQRASEMSERPNVGVVGLCMTGNFAWTLALEPIIQAPVAAAPSLPLGVTQRARAGLHMSAADRERAAVDETPLLAFRFEGDPACGAARFAALRGVFGDRLEAHVLPDLAQNKETGNPFPHALLTKDLVDEEGAPTHDALKRVLAFLEARLRPARS